MGTGALTLGQPAIDLDSLCTETAGCHVARQASAIPLHAAAHRCECSPIKCAHSQRPRSLLLAAPSESAASAHRS
eukprot:3131183-Alexandrium_andersonii.AAC.1